MPTQLNQDDIEYAAECPECHSITSIKWKHRYSQVCPRCLKKGLMIKLRLFPNKMLDPECPAMLQIDYKTWKEYLEELEFEYAE
jgi:hypothetical protein